MARGAQFRFALTFAAATTPNVGGTHYTKVGYAAVGNADRVVLDYVIRRFNLSSARLSKPQGLDLR